MQAPKLCRNGQPGKGAAQCHLVHPLGKTLCVGQLVLVSVPAAVGTPTALQLAVQDTASSVNTASSPLNQVPAMPEGQQANTRFVTCWQGDWQEATAGQLQLLVAEQPVEVGPVPSPQPVPPSAEWTSAG